MDHLGWVRARPMKANETRNPNLRILKSQCMGLTVWEKLTQSQCSKTIRFCKAKCPVIGRLLSQACLVARSFFASIFPSIASAVRFKEFGSLLSVLGSHCHDYALCCVIIRLQLTTRFLSRSSWRSSPSEGLKLYEEWESRFLRVWPWHTSEASTNRKYHECAFRTWRESR